MLGSNFDATHMWIAMRQRELRDRSRRAQLLAEAREQRREEQRQRKERLKRIAGLSRAQEGQ